MPTLLHIDSSPRTASVSSKLAAAFARRWQRLNPAGSVVHHNTTLENIPYIDEEHIAAAFTPADKLTEEQKQKLAYSDRLVTLQFRECRFLCPGQVERDAKFDVDFWGESDSQLESTESTRSGGAAARVVRGNIA